MPDKTIVGGFFFMTCLMACSTQSVGVPSIAKRLARSLRMRSVRRSVSEWLAPLCSCSGATTQTSGQRERATFSSSRMPGAPIPSSFEMRMREFPRSIGRSNMAGDDLEPAHVGAQRLRHCDAAVRLLVVLQDRDQRAPDGEPGAVQR